MKGKLKKQTRNFELNDFHSIEETEEMRVFGYASVFEKPTVLFEMDGVEYKEVIARNAFDKADFSDCCLKYNHCDSVPILARTRGGSLTTEIDDFGLKFDAKLFDTSAARDVYTLVKNRCLDKCSFAFTVEESSFNKETHTHVINKIGKVFDISIVDIPAYDDTTVEARSFFELESKKEQELESELAVRRKRVILKTY